MKRGVLLVAAGLGLSWFLDLGSANEFLAYSMGEGVRSLAIPGWGLGGAGAVLLVAGAVLVFAGRRPFEYSLGGKALVALLLVLLGVGLEQFAHRFLLDRLGEFASAGDASGVAWMYKSVLLWSFLMPALAVLGILLLVFDLLSERGLRFAFYGILAFAVAGLATLVVGWVPIDLAVAPFGTPDFNLAAFNRILGPALLPQRFGDLAWRTVFGLVYLRTYRRIARWEIPVPPEAHGPSPAPRPG